jgi:hypothetical protein
LIFFRALRLFTAGIKDTMNKIGNIFDSLFAKVKRAPKVLREVFYGMTLHEMDLELKRERYHLDTLYRLVVFGDMVGLPLLPPYYSMRLLPYIIPSMEIWKRSLFREKDITDFANMDI